MEKALRATLLGGHFKRVPPARSKVMSSIRSQGNRSTEVRIRLALVRARARGWKLHFTGLPGKPDFYFLASGLAIFVDGCFWHGCPRCGHIPKTNTRFWQTKISRNKKRDSVTNRILRAKGIAILRLWEHDVQCNLAVCLTKIFNYQARLKSLET